MNTGNIVAGKALGRHLAPARAIRLERIELVYAQGPVLVRGSFMTAMVTALFVYTHVDRSTLALWLGANALLFALREWNLRDYRRYAREERESRSAAFAARFTAGSVINGVLWGLVPVLFARHDSTTLALIFAVHGGYTAAAATSSVLWWPAFLGFVLPSSALFFGTTLYFHSGQLWTLSIGIVLFTVLVVLLGRRHLHALLSQIELRLENQALLEDVRAQRDRAEAAMDAKSRFLAAASHDLRQPVHALTLFSYALAPHLDSPQARQILERMQQSTDALGALFHGLLELSKLDAKIVRCEPRHVRLNTLFDALEGEFRADANDRELYLHLPREQSPVAFVDPSLLESVLRNLLDNALKYTRHGGVTLSLDLTRPGSLCLAVRDSGRGIPQSEFETIFSEHHQLGNPERDRRKGLGLGLAIVRRLCDLMGTELAVRSAVGEGSVFTVCLPLGIADEVDPEARPVSVVPDLAGLVVLVVDDEPDILEGMGQVLAQWGCRTTLASSLPEALALTREPPDIIIADYRLRENAIGIEAIEQLREEYNAMIPALLVTGETDPEKLRDADRAALTVLNKPIEPITLRLAIEGQLDGRVTIKADLALAKGRECRDEHSARDIKEPV